jgi:hypothetical protein
VLSAYLKRENKLEGFRHIELEFDQAVTDFRYQHNLGFLPKDLIKTRFIGPGELTFDYDQFTDTEIVLSTSGACLIRFFLGTFSG